MTVDALHGDGDNSKDALVTAEGEIGDSGVGAEGGADGAGCGDAADSVGEEAGGQQVRRHRDSARGSGEDRAEVLAGAGDVADVDRAVDAGGQQ